VDVPAVPRLVTALVIVTVLAGGLVMLATEPAGAAACSVGSQRAWDAGCAITYVDSGLVVEEVAYTVDGIVVRGLVCRPLVPPPGGSPVLVVNHALGVGAASERDACNAYPRSGGYVVLVSEYRPVGADPPFDDGCLGEVDDVIAMVDRARTLSYVDDSRIVMRGASLGGCVTLRIHQRGMPGLRAAAAINPGTDMADVWTNADRELTENLCIVLTPVSPACRVWRNLRNAITDMVGGPPGPATEAAYDARSPVHFAARTANSAVPLLIVQGGADHVVPLEQTCRFVEAVDGAAPVAGPFRLVRFGPGADGFPIEPSAPEGCPELGPWQTVNPAPTYPAGRYLMVLDGLDHATPLGELGVATSAANLFLGAKDG
jgi:alpha-beta hydrolase superfamily lysophospholipase